MTTVAETTHEHHGHGHDHPEHVAHHFESARQQYDAGKLGIWMFLITEILFFSGMFCAYAVYRSLHPEIFIDAAKELNTMLGAFNTVVLIVSSFTMAWAVRAAQLSQKKLLVVLLWLTLLLAGVFLLVKAKEYTDKFNHGLYPGVFNRFAQEQYPAVTEAVISSYVSTETPAAPAEESKEAPAHGEEHGSTEEPSSGAEAGHEEHAEEHGHDDHEHAAEGDAHHGGAQGVHNIHIFFGIYYMMTGIHAIHIIGGMGVIIWLIVRAHRGEFSSEYFGPVDFTGLYWHLVDLIWIFLFPLLYLIH
ncbi:cytochrome c oxidase subunit 3 [Blastopirellula sp. JC732]|uniref:Cytochrome c oxidase subunit 3 n=1 Tax=Blastopirellula sediminis TaxID=2894196 RepID=A0A9X1MLA8_9BACT|nr:cytochrome c oxidase subunit 3 [Blastopirellula sediminis]MCC9608883.1 cytochrome c oxidase subunit 3 [Blastopirellula sediminis]MCC9628340.1 cytochrome c oxidase subunit 3 [Blastopirellula sediminis]